MAVDKQKLRDLASKATPGPWWFAYATVRKTFGADDEYSVADMPRIAGDTETRQGGADGEYIAAVSPDVVLALLDEHERLCKLVEEACDIASMALHRDDPQSEPRANRIAAIREETRRG